MFRAATEQSQGFKSSLATLLREKEEMTAGATKALAALSEARTQASAAKTDLSRLSARMASAAAPMKGA